MSDTIEPKIHLLKEPRVFANAKKKQAEKRAAKTRERFTLTEFDKELCAIVAEQPAVKIIELCDLLDCGRAKVKNSLKKQSVKNRLARMRATRHELTEILFDTCVKRLMQLVNQADPALSLAALKMITPALFAEKTQNFKIDQTNTQIYEVQIGPEGQVYQSHRGIDAN